MYETETSSSDTMTPPSSPSYSRRSCFAMLDKVCPHSPLPRECERYQDIKVELQRRNSDRDNHSIAFAGMNPMEAAAAKAARERGALHHAQIQRRMTSDRKKTIW